MDEQTPNPDDFEGIFNDLTPDMFETTTSAVDEEEGAYEGHEAFVAMVKERQRAVRTAYANMFGQMNPTAVLVSATKQRTFVPQEDETIGDFLGRLRREAIAMEAHWFFFARKQQFKLWFPESGLDHTALPDATAMSSFDEAPNATPQQEGQGVLYYAERREVEHDATGSLNEREHGIMTVQHGRIDQTIAGDPRQTNAIFELVLSSVRLV